jgi:hypothetical protein
MENVAQVDEILPSDAKNQWWYFWGGLAGRPREARKKSSGWSGLLLIPGLCLDDLKLQRAWFFGPGCAQASRVQTRLAVKTGCQKETRKRMRKDPRIANTIVGTGSLQPQKWRPWPNICTPLQRYVSYYCKKPYEHRQHLDLTVR